MRCQWQRGRSDHGEFVDRGRDIVTKLDRCVGLAIRRNDSSPSVFLITAMLAVSPS
jgi:hypothetical protein